jgi:hypothetical protein
VKLAGKESKFIKDMEERMHIVRRRHMAASLFRPVNVRPVADRIASGDATLLTPLLVGLYTDEKEQREGPRAAAQREKIEDRPEVLKQVEVG